MYKMMIAIAIALGTGCATEDMLAEDEQALSAGTNVEQTGVRCTNKAWQVDFYAEPARINRVGWLRCDCFAMQLRDGVTVTNTVLAYEFTCDLN